MKRDWDLLREQMLAIEGDLDFEMTVLEGAAELPVWGDDQTEAEYLKIKSEHERNDARIFGHLELLIESGFVEGVTVSRYGKSFSYGLTEPRLTMAGHDLLDTIRSKPVWEKVKSMAKTKGLELTLDTVKALADLALKAVIGS